MTNFTRIYQRYTRNLRDSIKMIDHFIHLHLEDGLTIYRDGGDGWTVLEVLCHLRDYDRIFLNRARQILSEDQPLLVNYDHEALAIENRYNEQSVEAVLQDLMTSRFEMASLFEGLTEEADWHRYGTHPEVGHWSIFNQLLQVNAHDIDHMEQMTRILLEKRTA